MDHQSQQWLAEERVQMRLMDAEAHRRGKEAQGQAPAPDQDEEKQDSSTIIAQLARLAAHLF